MKANTRKINISRKVSEMNKKGEMVLVSKEFPVKVNRGVPFNHRMCQ